MEKYKNTALLICLIVSAYMVLDKIINRTQKIGVIQMDKLVYDFKGMKEATEKYSIKMKRWSAESDSLEGKLQGLLTQIRLDSINKDRNKLNRDIEAFVLYKRSYTEYVQNSQEKAQEEDKEMTLGVVNQVNEYIKAYAQQEGFDVILTNTQQQSVGYVKGMTDVTGNVLDYANKKYEGVK